MPRARKAQGVVIIGFGNRVERALDAYERRLGVRKVSDEDFAAVMRDALGSPKLQQSTVGRWRAGTIPDAKTIATLARVCGVDPGWLAFGELSTARKFPPGSDDSDVTDEGLPAPFPGAASEAAASRGQAGDHT
jgi:hypothetical protein